MTRYARSTVVPLPSTDTNRNAVASAAWTRIATYGVFHLGCTLPNAGGKYRSRPIANATRAGAVSHAPTPPTFPIVYAAAASGASHHSAGLSAFAPIEMLCSSPETMFTSPTGTIRSSAHVPSTYAAAMSGADTRTARGSVRRGLRTSPPIELESSSPANAKAIDAHKLSPERPRFGTTLLGVIGFADGRPVAT